MPEPSAKPAAATGYPGQPTHSRGTSVNAARATGGAATGRSIPASQVPPALRGPEEATEPKKGLLGLSGGQVIAGALAASTSAVAASYLGVAGTVLGAGLGSVIATVSTAVYQKSIQRSGKVLQTVVTTTAGGQQVPVDEVMRGGRDSTTVAPDPSLLGTAQADRHLPDPHVAQTHPMGAVPDDATRPFGVPLDGTGATGLGATGTGRPAYGSASVPPPNRPAGTSGTVYGGPSWYSGLPWKRIGLTSAALFILVMGIITTIEVIEGRTVADAVKGEQGDGTTVGRVVTNDGDTGSSPVPSESGSSTEDATPTATPSEEPTSSDGTTESPEGEPTESPDPSDPSEDDGSSDGQSEQPAPIQTQGADESSSAPVQPLDGSVTTAAPSADALVR